MTITAKLVSKPGGGHGLDEALLTGIYGELIKGKSAGLIPALVLLQPKNYGGSAGNSKLSVQFEVVRLEPVVDEADAQRIREAIADAYGARQNDGQSTLDLGEEDARRYLAYLEEWRKSNSLSVKALNEIWRENFPPESGTIGDYRKAGHQPLYEFCLANGVLPDEVVGEIDPDPVVDSGG